MTGARVTVHGFEVWDITRDHYRASGLKSTPDRIAQIQGGRVLPGTEEQIDASLLDGNGIYDPGASGPHEAGD